MAKRKKRPPKKKSAPKSKRSRTPKSSAKWQVTTQRTGKIEIRTIEPVRGKARGAASPGKRATAAKSPAQAVLAPTILTVFNEDLARLGAGEAVDLIRELLWAEARRVGVSTAQINVSAAVNMSDGGIDASVSSAPSSMVDSLLKPGRTSHQIKASGAFEPWQEAHLRKELFGKEPPARDNLGESVRRCLDENGTYVLVCTKCDLDEMRQNKAIDGLKKLFAACGYKHAKVEVWSQNTLVGLLDRFPSLRLKVNGREQLRFQTHRSWSLQDDMKKSLKIGEAQTKFIEALASELRKAEGPVHAQVWGDAGIGKTRLVLEATGAPDLRPLVIYCDSAEKFRDSDLMNEILKEDSHFSAVIVVDECDADSRSYIWNKLKGIGERVKLVTIHNEFDETAGDITYIDAPPLADEQIVEIIKEYVAPAGQAERWAEYCSGSPRVAHVIGLNLKANPEDLLRAPDTVNVWDRYIVGRDDASSQKVEQRRMVLRYLALFKRFGYGGRLVHEAKAIAAVIEAANPNVTWARFQEIVAELRARKILQGENTLYITPKLLHIRLWTDWWDTYGTGFDIEEFAAGLSQPLLEWFHDMFRYAAESQAAQRIVKELLEENGIFQASEYLRDPRGAKFFLALSEATPEAALQCLKDTVGGWDRQTLLEFTTGRREVIWALERIAVWRELFPDAARLLLKLGEAENETWGNNASGVFAGLFSPGPRQVAPTEAPPEERFPVLREAMESASKEQRLLALRAADSALEAHHFSRASGAEYQGLRRQPRLWAPQTYGEIFDAYRRVWRLLYDSLEGLPEDERRQAVDILLKRTRGLARHLNLQDMLMETLGGLIQRGYADRKQVFDTLQRLLHYDGKRMPDDARRRWESLKNSLLGDDFHSLMQRYVAMDLLEDHFDEEGKHADMAAPHVDRLAAQAIQNSELLNAELSWLVTDEAKSGFRFGYALAARDDGFALLPTLLRAQRETGENGSAFFLGGYVRRLRETDLARWESLLDELSLDPTLRLWVPELTWRSGFMTDRAARRVLELARSGAIKIAYLRMFGAGSVTAELSPEIITEWIEFLIDEGSPVAVSIALDVHHFYFTHKDVRAALPRVLTLKLLTAPSLFERRGERNQFQMDEYHWTELGKAFLDKYPEDGLLLADKMLEHFGEDGTILEGFRSSTFEVLDLITRRFPNEVWKRLTKYLGPPIDSRAHDLTSWLRGDEHYPSGERGMLPAMPLNEVWQWVDANVEERAWYVAYFAPRQLFRREGEVCLAREILARYGHRRDVRSNLMANFGTESWWGPESAHYTAKKQELLEFRRGETNKNVMRWIDEFVASLDRQIERAKIEEEREH